MITVNMMLVREWKIETVTAGSSEKFPYNTHCTEVPLCDCPWGLHRMATLCPSAKAMFFFSVVIYGCEDWTVKKAECQRIDDFELWCWRRLLRVPWTARTSNQAILKEIDPEYSLDRLMLKLKLQYFGHLMRRTDLFEKTLILGKIEGGRRSVQ